MKDWNLKLEFKPQDAWIGAFWKRDGNCLDLWVCLLPCVPIHFSCWGRRWGMPSLDPAGGAEGEDCRHCSGAGLIDESDKGQGTVCMDCVYNPGCCDTHDAPQHAEGDGAKGELARFGHHSDPAIDFTVEVESLQGRLFNAQHGIAKMGESPETVEQVRQAIERALQFQVGGDQGCVYAKHLLRELQRQATPPPAEGDGAVACDVAGYLEIMADLAQPPMFGDHTTRLNDACKALCRQAAKLLRTRPAATAQVPDEVRALPERWRTKKRGLSALGCANELALALAAPAAPKGVVVDDKRTIYDQRTKVTEACERAGPLLYTALKNLLEAVRERDLQQSIESVVLSDADMALAAARNPELQP